MKIEMFLGNRLWIKAEDQRNQTRRTPFGLLPPKAGSGMVIPLSVKEGWKVESVAGKK